jgi:hypothetical protein
VSRSLAVSTARNPSTSLRTTVARSRGLNCWSAIGGCFGTVDIWRVPHDLRGDYGKIQQELEERQRLSPP